MTRDNFCSKHNRQKDSVKVGDFFVYSCQQCRIENERDADQLAEINAKQKEAKKEEFTKGLFENANIPERFDRDLSQFETTTPDQAKAFADTKTILRKINEKTGLVFLGPPGTGKTHLAIYCLRQILAWGKTGRFVEAIKIFRASKESWRRDDAPRESEVLKSFVKPFLLVIDEIGVQFGSATERMIITEIINDRYNALKPTILCANLAMEEMSKCIGDRAWDRFQENGAVIVLHGKSYRCRK